MAEPSRVLPLPSGELVRDDVVERVVKTAVAEAFRLLSERETADSPAARPAIKVSTNAILTSVIVLLVAFLGYREYSRYESDRDDRIFRSLEVIRDDQIALQGAVNQLYTWHIGADARPVTLEPLHDAISHGTTTPSK